MGKDKDRNPHRAVNTPTAQPLANSLQPPAQNNDSNKWVINLSSTHLSQAQGYLLAKGPNYAVIPKNPPYLEYITSIESVCQKLDHQEGEELRVDINRVLRIFDPLNPI